MYFITDQAKDLEQIDIIVLDQNSDCSTEKALNILVDTVKENRRKGTV